MGDLYRLTSQQITPPPLFEDLAAQLFHHVIDPQDVGSALREKVSVEGDTWEQVLKEWITVLLNLIQVQKMVLKQFHVSYAPPPEGHPHVLRADVLGELIDPLRHTLSSQSRTLRCGHVSWKVIPAGYQADVELIS